MRLHKMCTTSYRNQNICIICLSKITLQYNFYTQKSIIMIKMIIIYRVICSQNNHNNNNNSNINKNINNFSTFGLKKFWNTTFHYSIPWKIELNWTPSYYYTNQKISSRLQKNMKILLNDWIKKFQTIRT